MVNVFHFDYNVITWVRNRYMLDFIAKFTVKRVFDNKFLITYILSSRIFVAPPRYTLLCSKSRFTHSPAATAVKVCLKSTISVPCNPSRMISTWCHCSSCKVKSVDITVAPCPRLNLHFKKHKRPILTIKLHPLVVDKHHKKCQWWDSSGDSSSKKEGAIKGWQTMLMKGQHSYTLVSFPT